jgi:hypothetical protein
MKFNVLNREAFPAGEPFIEYKKTRLQPISLDEWPDTRQNLGNLARRNRHIESSGLGVRAFRLQPDTK